MEELDVGLDVGLVEEEEGGGVPEEEVDDPVG